MFSYIYILEFHYRTLWSLIMLFKWPGIFLSLEHSQVLERNWERKKPLLQGMLEFPLGKAGLLQSLSHPWVSKKAFESYQNRPFTGRGLLTVLFPRKLPQPFCLCVLTLSLQRILISQMIWFLNLKRMKRGIQFLEADILMAWSSESQF